MVQRLHRIQRLPRLLPLRKSHELLQRHQETRQVLRLNQLLRQVQINHIGSGQLLRIHQAVAECQSQQFQQVHRVPAQQTGNRRNFLGTLHKILNERIDQIMLQGTGWRSEVFGIEIRGQDRLPERDDKGLLKNIDQGKQTPQTVLHGHSSLEHQLRRIHGQGQITNQQKNRHQSLPLRWRIHLRPLLLHQPTQTTRLRQNTPLERCLSSIFWVCQKLFKTDCWPLPAFGQVHWGSQHAANASR